MKTITYLNTKAWYRALKVVYAGFVIICYSIAISGIVIYTDAIINDIDLYKHRQNDINQRIQKIEEMKKIGQTTEEITTILYGGYRESGQIKLTREEFAALYGEQELDKLNLPVQRESDNSMSEPWLILLFPLYIVFAFILSEIPKRIFYYIYFGKIKPDIT